MAAKNDFTFIYTLANVKSGVAFCTSKDLTVEQAKRKVFETLSKVKESEISELNYMGSLDYSGMEKGILNQLNMFEKHNPVWILNATED